MNDDKVDDMSLAIRRRSSGLAAVRQESKDTDGHTAEKNETEDEEDGKGNDVADLSDNPKKNSKRQMDFVAQEGGEDKPALDGSSHPKKIKKAELVNELKDGKKDGLKKGTPAATSGIPGSSSYPTSSVSFGGPSEASLLSAVVPSLVDKAGPNTTVEDSMRHPATCDVKQMQHIQSVMDELKNVPDITEMIRDDTDQTAVNSKQRSSSAPGMVSEGMRGRFHTVNFYWLDMFEDQESPGVLFIFGKFKSPPPGNGYSSGCIVVKNLNRRVFLLPRETREDGTSVDYMDVYNEFYTELAPQLTIPSFQCKRSKRKYCFDIEGIPPEAEYVEVRYPGSAPALPQDVKGETFSHAFGTNTSLMETFLLEKKIKGPSWLQLSYCERVQSDQQQSWSKFEFTCDASNVKVHPDSSKFPVPTLILASLQTETVDVSDLKRNSFIFAGVAVHRNFDLQLPSTEICHDFVCLINTPAGHTWPNGVQRIMDNRIVKMDSESSMLECLVNKLHELDVDVYLDYGEEFNCLLNRLSDLKVPNRSKIGRLQWPTSVAVKKGNSSAVIQGRLLCDLTASRMPHYIGTYSAVLKRRNGRQHLVSSLASSEIKALFTSSEHLESLVKWGMKHCALKIREMNELRLLPLVFQYASIAGSSLFGTPQQASLHRKENLMLHVLSARKYIVPDGCQLLQNHAVAESQDVQEPILEEGFYDTHVLELLFNRYWLRPCALTKFQFLLSNLDTEDGAEEPRRTMQNELRKLGESRKQVERLMKMEDVTEDMMWQYEIRQAALRTATMDVLFDCCLNSRFHSNSLQVYVQAQVRDLLLKVKEIVSKMGYEVIKSDERSIMIHTPSREISGALEIEKKVLQEIRQTYSLHWVFISRVGIYRYLLLLKDNKYAGLLYDPNSESKYEIVLKNFDVDPSGELPVIVSKTAHACLTEILSEQPICDKVYKVGKILWDVSSRLRYRPLPLEELLISKTLTKNPEEYDDSQGLHHVTVALRINKSKKLGEKFRKGDQVSYLLCKDGCPRHLSEMKSKKDEETNVKVDADYYLAQLIHPAVSEICERIPGLGLDSARVRDALGLGVNSTS